MDILTNVSVEAMIASWFVIEVIMVTGFLVAVVTLKKVVGLVGVQVRLQDLVRRLVPVRVVYVDRDCECDEDHDYDNEDDEEDDEDDDK